MKTTIDIDDALFQRMRRHARRVGRPMRAIVEEGLRRVLEDPQGERAPFQMPDRSVGRAGDANPLEGLSWHELRDQIYGGR